MTERKQCNSLSQYKLKRSQKGILNYYGTILFCILSEIQSGFDPDKLFYFEQAERNQK